MSRPREFNVEHVLAQCMEVFWTKGFKSTSFEELTRTTQVKKQSFYCVFEDKRALFLKALAMYREQTLERMEHLAQQRESPLAILEELRQASLFDGDEALRRGCLMVNSALEFGTSDEAVTREIEAMFEETERILEQVIRSGQEQRLITERYTAAELASHLTNAISGARLMEKSGASQERIDAVLRTSFALITP